MKKIFVLLLLAFAACCPAADIPALRNLNALEVHFLPDAVDRKVEFTFEKQDLNGYAGTDAIVFTLMSPSGKNVWEEAVQDDGNITNNWKTGLRKQVKVVFTPKEAGVYVMKCNTSSPDINLQFDRAMVKNAAWGFASGSFRFSGNGKLDCYVLLVPKKLGEMQKQVMQICTTRHSKVKNLSVTTLSGKQVLKTFSLPFTARMTYHNFAVERFQQENIYRFTAENFGNVVRFIFPQYGSMMLFTDESSAKRFDRQSRITGSILQLEAGKKHPALVLGGKRTFLASFMPENSKGKYNFTLDIAGVKTILSDQKSKNIVTTADGIYHPVDLSKAPAGKLELIAVAENANALQPESGSVASNQDELVWNTVAGISEYELVLTEAISRKTIKVKVAGNRYLLDKIPAGVWQWQVFANGKSGKKSFVVIPQKAESMLPYCYDPSPVMDAELKQNPEELACRVGLLKVDDIDFQRSHVLVNGKKYRVKKLSSTRIEVAEAVSYQNGRNQICMVIYSKSGVRSEKHWGFYLNAALQYPRFTHDDNGNIFCDGTPFYPVIYYGYRSKELPLERQGFNTVLGNTLPSRANLNQLLARNLKLLDSGSVYYGIYSKPKTMAGSENDVKRIAGNGGLRHPARIGAWMDEMDVHRTVNYIEKFLKLFGDKKNGWRGVCACNVALYNRMAEIGDFLMIDHYGVGKTIFSTDTATVEGKVAAGSKPLLSLVKGFSASDPKLTGFIPDALDVEYAAFSTLRNRANALGIYQCGEYRLECDRETWKSTIDVYKRVSALVFALYGEDADKFLSVKSSSGKPGFRAVKHGNALYIIAQNASFDPAIFEFALNKVAAKEVKVLFENRSLKLMNGKFADAFTQRATHIYYIELD